MTSGPTLEQYLETRLNLFTEALREQVQLHKESITALKSLLEAAQLASDLRYQQRFDAQSDALSAAFASQQTAMSTALVTAEKAVLVAQAAADRAVSKAELAADKRFESVNEFRQTLTDQQQTFMPRRESEALHASAADKLSALEKLMDVTTAERAGIKGGWGYAVGVVGFLLALGSLALIALKFLGKG